MFMFFCCLSFLCIIAKLWKEVQGGVLQKAFSFVFFPVEKASPLNLAL